jgi:hypothetical protein
MEGGIQRLPEKSSTEDKCIESLQDSFVKISTENTPERSCSCLEPVGSRRKTRSLGTSRT